MKKRYSAILLLVFTLTFTSCFEDYDDNPQYSSLEVKDFIWTSLNYVYLYKNEVPDLADDRFSSNDDYVQYLDGYASPEALFEDLKYNPNVVDRFSRLFDNYIELEQLLNGTSLNNGMEFSLYLEPGSETNVFGVIKMILNNSNASNAGLSRGQFFSAVDGTELTTANYQDLLSQNSYSLTLATYDNNGTPEITDDTVNTTSETISLTKTAYNENPVYKTEVINVNGGEKLGYLMYNGFYPEYDNQLNDAFAYFQSNNINYLVLDLRYNGGGNVQTATYLGSMVTGQFNGSVFSKLEYNENLANNNTNYLFTNSIASGGNINSLNLDKVYVITTGSTASASEMIINSLKEYITVIQVGTTTVGKSQASRIVYDSPSFFSKQSVNPNHSYAMLPLIGISVNANDGQVPSTGIEPSPDLTLTESIINLGVLGDVNEPLLATVISHIEDNNRPSLSREDIFINPEKLDLPIKETDYILYE